MLNDVSPHVRLCRARVGKKASHRLTHRQLKRLLKAHHVRMAALIKLLARELAQGHGRDYGRVRDLLAEIARVNRRISVLASRIRVLEERLDLAHRRIDQLGAAIAPVIGDIQGMRRIFLNLQGSVITVITDAGPVTGTLTLVGTDVIQLMEADGDIVLIPLSQVNSATT